jgi:hypothetical protein
MTKLSPARIIPLMVLLLGTVSGCATYEKCGIEGSPKRPKDHGKGGGHLSPASGAWDTSWCADIEPSSVFVRYRQ